MDHPPLVLASAVRGHRSGAAIIWWLRRDIPESPRWLAVHGRYDEADAIVKQLEANGSELIDAAAKADTSDTRNAGAEVEQLEYPTTARTKYEHMGNQKGKAFTH